MVNEVESACLSGSAIRGRAAEALRREGVASVVTTSAARGAPGRWRGRAPGPGAAGRGGRYDWSGRCFLRRACGERFRQHSTGRRAALGGSGGLVVGDPARYRERLPERRRAPPASRGGAYQQWPVEMVKEDFASFRARSADAGFSDWLRAENQAPWDAMVGHRFCLDMATDRLPEPAFVRYLRYEHGFIRAAIGIFAYALAKAPTAADQDHLIRVLGALAGEQEDYSPHVHPARPGSRAGGSGGFTGSGAGAARRRWRLRPRAASQRSSRRCWRRSGCISPGARRRMPEVRGAKRRPSGSACTSSQPSEVR